MLAHVPHRKVSRRTFVKNVAAAGASFALLPRVSSAGQAPMLAADPLRPQFHLLPAANWMNDPNGPIYWHGQYHMFFQYNPGAAVWGDMHWAHAVSADMVHWKHLPIALAPTPGGADQDGCFTGSAVDDHGTATFVYTGVRSAPAAQATLRDGVNNFRETQCLATSQDTDLRTWKKVAQPIIEPPSDPLLTGFRDPFLWKEGDVWYLGVASGLRKQGGRVLIYRSKDLRQWENVSVLVSGKWNGKDTPDVVDSGEMWECPDFFALGGKHVLIYSTERKVYWQSGELDHAKMEFHSQRQGLLDTGAYYAPKTQTGANGERILWGWITEKRSDDELRKAGWAGCMSLPRVLTLDADGQLLMRPAREVAKLRTSLVALPGPAVTAADRRTFLQKMRITNLAGEVSLRIRNAPFAMQLSDGRQDFLTLAFAPAESGSEFSVNDVGIVLPAATTHQQEMSITVFIDGSVVEVFVNDHAAHTARVYRPPANPLQLEMSDSALQNVVSLQAWQIAPISPDRLTT
jgi:beta-fructofuranosidase